MAKTNSSERKENKAGGGTNAAAAKAQKPAPVEPAAPPARVAPLFRRVDWLALGITFAVMWIAYYITLSPELTLQDSGELAVGSYYAGVPHPPGYPVWTLYTWLWTVLIPVGNVAWRVSLGEATAGAMAAGLLAMMVSRGSSMFMESIEDLRSMTGKWENAICLVAGFAAGLLMGFNGFVWSQAVIVEVYLFSVLSLMMMLLFLLRWMYAPQQMRYAYWAAFMFGICITNHQSLLVAAIGFEVTLAVANPRLGRDIFFGNFIIYLLDYVWLIGTGDHFFHNIGAKPMLLIIFNLVGLGSLAISIWLATRTKKFLTEFGHVALMLVLFMVGASFYLYMPIAGMTNPPIQWGYPRTVEGFFHALTRGQYEQPNPTNVLAEPGRFLSQLGMLIANIGEEFTLVYAFLAVVPFIFFYKMQRREKSWIIGLVAFYLCLGVLLMILLNPTPDRASKDLVKVFFTASHTVVAAMVGYGIALTAAYMATHYQKFRLWGMIGGAAAVLLAVYELVSDTAKTYFGEGGHPAFSQVFAQIKDVFGRDQYALPVYAGLVLVFTTIVFLGAVLVYRRRAPLAIALAIFALMPVNLALNNWADNEQHDHMFGYWFGHDMFTPPFKGTDGKPLYPEMTKDAILYGGTDPGRFCPTYMIFCESFIPHKCQPPEDQKFDRRDVYIITQNALADGTYLNYIRAHYNRSTQIDPPFFRELFRTIFRDKEYTTNLLARAVEPLDTFFTDLGEKVEKRRRVSTSWFTDKDFTNFSAFTSRLAPGANQDPVSKFLYDNLSEDTRKLLGSSGNQSRLKAALAKDLNMLLEREILVRKKLTQKEAQKRDVDQEVADGNSSSRMKTKQEQLAKDIAELSKVGPLYTPERFQKVQLSEYLQDFIKENPQSHTRIRLNRLLLEATYPDAVAKSLGGVYPDREMYIATPDDSQRCFQEYLGDASKRLKHDMDFPNEPRQVRPGEDVKVVDNKVTVAGQVAVMAINGLLTKVMFEHNPKNEFFVEESFPLDWMYPHLTPYGVIMKINRQPLPTLSEDVMQHDHDFWKQYSKRLTGDFIDYDTPVKQISDWIEKTYLRRDYTGFKGDRKFIRDNDAQKAFSKLRSSIGGVYAWRVSPQCPAEFRPKSDAEFQRIVKEADFTFKQAFAYCPYSPEAVFRYVNLLLQLNRLEDALLVAQSCQKLDPNNGQVDRLVNDLKGYRGQQAGMNQMRAVQTLEEEVRKNPTNPQTTLELARVYAQMQQNAQAAHLVDQVVNDPHATGASLVRAAQVYAQIGNMQGLEVCLDKLVKASPDNPEAWYDLAAYKASVGKTNEAWPAFRKAIELSSARLQRDPKSADLVAAARNEQRFATLRVDPDFQKLVPAK